MSIEIESIEYFIQFGNGVTTFFCEETVTFSMWYTINY